MKLSALLSLVTLPMAPLVTGCSGPESADDANPNIAGRSTSGGNSQAGATSAGGALNEGGSTPNVGGAALGGAVGGGGSGASGAAGTGGAAGAGGGGAATKHGKVHFVTYPAPDSQWTQNPKYVAGLKQVYDEFEANLLTGGAWDATIEVCLSKNPPGGGAYGQSNSMMHEVQYKGQRVRVPIAWDKIVLNGPDAEGAPNPDLSKGCDFTMLWNFSAGPAYLPESNLGLTRHETLHGLGAQSVLSNRFAEGDATLRWTPPATRIVPTVNDLSAVDLNGDPLVYDYDAGSSNFALRQNPKFLSDHESLGSLKGGLRLKAIDDSGAPYFMDANPNGESTQNVWFEFEHPVQLMYNSSDPAVAFHPNFNHLDVPDRAWFRMMGYTVARDVK